MRIARYLVAAMTAGAMVSCSSGPRPPEKGTPAFNWQAAQETFAGGDYGKTLSFLDLLVKAESEFTARAKPWRAVVLWGMVKGHLDIAERFDYGAKQNKNNPAPFRKQVNDARSAAANAAMQLAEAWKSMKEGAGQADVELDFPLPPGSAAPVAALNKAAGGILLADTEAETAKRQALQRAMLLVMAQAAGAGDDVAKARALLQTRPAKVAGADFLAAMGQALYDASSVFDSRSLDRPEVMQMLCADSSAVVGRMADGKAKKELQAKVQECLKKGKKKS